MATRNYLLNYLYGLSESEFGALLARQDGRCAVCRSASPGGRWGRFCVDHDHGCCPSPRGHSACVRGIVCNQCNVRLGQVERGLVPKKADDGWMVAADRYLRPWSDARWNREVRGMAA